MAPARLCLYYFLITFFITTVFQPSSIHAAISPADRLTVDQLNYSSLQQLIINKNLKTIEDTLPYLPQEYFSNFVMMHSSMSLQKASLENPRVLLFGPTAKFVISYNGSHLQKGYYDFEILEFDPKTKVTNLYEITFPQQTSGAVRFSQANPPKCLECHTSFPKPNGVRKPIWNAYPSWPGAYGFRKSSLTYSEKKEREFKAFDTDKRATHPRYKFLNFKTAERRTVGMRHERPNLRLYELLIFNYGIALAEKIKKHPLFKAAPLHVLTALWSHNLEYAPTSSPLCLEKDFPFAVDNRAAEEFLETRLGLHKSVFHTNFDENRHGSNHFLTFIKNRASLIGVTLHHLLQAAPQSATVHFEISKNKSAMYKNDEHEEHYTNLYSITESVEELTVKHCSQFRTALHIEAQAMVQNQLPLVELKDKPVIQRCYACHVTRYGHRQKTIGPYLPFDDPQHWLMTSKLLMEESLKYTAAYSNFSLEERRLSPTQPASKGGLLMPYGRKPLSKEERKELADYFH